MRFSQRPKKIFDFSGRFSESSNDELSAVRQAFLMIFTPSMRKIELKLVRFAILLKKDSQLKTVIRLSESDQILFLPRLSHNLNDYLQNVWSGMSLSLLLFEPTSAPISRKSVYPLYVYQSIQLFTEIRES